MKLGSKRIISRTHFTPLPRKRIHTASTNISIHNDLNQTIISEDKNSENNFTINNKSEKNLNNKFEVPNDTFIQKPLSIEQTDEFKCTICLRILNNYSVTTPCNHKFCQKCMNQY